MNPTDSLHRDRRTDLLLRYWQLCTLRHHAQHSYFMLASRLHGSNFRGWQGWKWRRLGRGGFKAFEAWAPSGSGTMTSIGEPIAAKREERLPTGWVISNYQQLTFGRLDTSHQGQQSLDDTTSLPYIFICPVGREWKRGKAPNIPPYPTQPTLRQLLN